MLQNDQNTCDLLKVSRINSTTIVIKIKKQSNYKKLYFYLTQPKLE